MLSEMFLMHRFNEVCARCGHRYGEHFGNKDEHWCENGTNPYSGPTWIPSGVYSQDRGKTHFDLLVGIKMNPNKIFKSMRYNKDNKGNN